MDDHATASTAESTLPRTGTPDTARLPHTPSSADPAATTLAMSDEARCTVLRQAELLRREAERLAERAGDIFTFDPDRITADLRQIDRALSCIRAALGGFEPAASDR
jgi:hypothetical protein